MFRKLPVCSFILGALLLAPLASAEPGFNKRDDGSYLATGAETSPYCPAKLVGLDVKSAAYLEDEKNHLFCGYGNDFGNVSINVRFFEVGKNGFKSAKEAFEKATSFRPASYLPESEASENCDRMLDMVQNAKKYDASVMDHPERIKASKKTYCSYSVAKDDAADFAVTLAAAQVGDQIVWVRVDGFKGALTKDQYLGAPMIITALQSKQPEWLQTLLDSLD